MSDTEWTEYRNHLDRYVNGYFMEIAKPSFGTFFLWTVADSLICATGHSRTVSAAKRQCMRAMNRHKREAQR